MENLIGKKFNKLTVVEVYPPRKGPVFHERSTAKFMCECGVSSIKTIKDVRSGKTKSCGCLSSRVYPGLINGSRYGSWVVLNGKFDAPQKKQKNSNRWRSYALCRCDCGAEKIIDKFSLTSGASTSCGCKNLTPLSPGEKINMLTVKRKTDNHWLCECECGVEVKVVGHKLKREKTKSCRDCARKAIINAATTHGMTDSITYKVWQGMKKRCTNKNDKNYYLYGGIGVKVCERWNDFENFYEDMGPRPSAKHSIDRIDPKGDYEPSNCRWATDTEQANNKRNNRYITHQGRTQTLMQWSVELNVNRHRISDRLKKGMTMGEIYKELSA